MIKNIRQRFREITDLNKINAKDTTPRHIMVKLLKIKDKEKILEAAKEKKKDMIFKEGKNKILNWFLNRNNGIQKTVT